MNRYKELRERQQKEFDNFPKFFAFGKEQFEKNIKEFGLTVDDTDKIVSIGYGGYILKKDVEAYNNLSEKHSNELQAAIDEDKTGEGFIYEMFRYELANHEYSYTREVEDTLYALDISPQDLEDNEALLNGLRKAIFEIEREDN